MMASIGLNKTNKIMTFEELGWSDPTLDPVVGKKKAIEWLRKLNFFDCVYPEAMTYSVMTPRCIFVPEKSLLRKLIRAVG